jgi:transcriptional regulator with XRE-family HTH domain
MSNRKLSARLRQRRIERNLTARALGDKVGVSDRQIYRYEWGTSTPSMETVRRLAKYLGKSRSWLMGWS